MRKTYRPWTSNEEDVIIAEYPAAGAVGVAEMLGRSRASVQGKAVSLGLRHDAYAMRDSIRHDYFTEIDTPVKAYVLGLLAADGNVQSERPIIRLVLNDKDRGVVEMVRDELAPEYPVRTYEGEDVAVFAVSSERIASDLGTYGIVPNKSLSLVFPSELPEDRWHDFLLGYFDGDGSLSYRRYKQGWKPQAQWDLYGQEAFLTEVKSIIEERVPISLRGPRQPREDRNMWVISTSGTRVPPLDAWLNQSGLGMDRKHL